MTEDGLITRRQIVRRVIAESVRKTGRCLRDWLAATFYVVVAGINVVWSPVAHAVWVCTKDREGLDDRFGEFFDNGEDR